MVKFCGKSAKEVFEIKVLAPQAPIKFKYELIAYCEQMRSAPR